MAKRCVVLFQGGPTGLFTSRRDDNMDAGVYLAIFFLPKSRSITIGRLGSFHLVRGYYLYVGSAQKNLRARLDRHARRAKPLRGHIDYLSVHAALCGALMLEAEKDLECRLAAALAQRYGRAIPHFGASDCRCGGHLFYLPPERHVARDLMR